jgi:hypothetical protein
MATTIVLYNSLAHGRSDVVGEHCPVHTGRHPFKSNWLASYFSALHSYEHGEIEIDRRENEETAACSS